MGKRIDPEKVFKEYKDGQNYKSQLYGGYGLYEQSKKNERFYAGDQWYGAKVGNNRPLFRLNIIKRIGDYKIAMIGAPQVTVNYSADGIPNTVDVKEDVKKIRDQIVNGEPLDENAFSGDENINIAMDALSEYYKVQSERLKLPQKFSDALQKAYITGQAILYVNWDSKVKTGLYADEARKTAIMGDIDISLVDVESFYLGEPNNPDIQSQPYIIIAQRKTVGELRREARMYGADKMKCESIQPDRDTQYYAGDLSDTEPVESKRATVLTRIWKEYNDNGDYTVKAVRVTNNTVIRPVWDIGIRLYPFASMCWQKRSSCGYGESEVSYLIPNQIAINRMITASVWSQMMNGMPITIVNSDIVQDRVTGDPGQILYCNDVDAVKNAVGYVVPPQISGNFDNFVSMLISDTLSNAGANDAALGNMRPDNTSAIIAVREAATMPLQTIQNTYYQFVEDTARIMAEFWIMMYGKRSLRINDENGSWYMPFDGDKYRDLIVSVKVDVGASTVWSEAEAIRTLDNMLSAGIITPIQYWQRVPKGFIPDVTGLIKDAKQQAEQQAAAESAEPSDDDIISQLPADKQDLFRSLPADQQQQLLNASRGV